MAEQSLPKNKQELLAVIREEWDALLDVIKQLDERQMTTADDGGWSPKDNLAHLAEWMKILMGYHMDKHPSHEVARVAPELTRDWDFDILNQAFFERNRNRTLDDVLDDVKRTYIQIITKLEVTSFDDLMQPRHPDDPEKRPLLSWVLGNTSEHFAEHRENIKKLIKEKHR